jgi:hypothetical protein
VRLPLERLRWEGPDTPAVSQAAFTESESAVLRRGVLP